MIDDQLNIARLIAWRESMTAALDELERLHPSMVRWAAAKRRTANRAAEAVTYEDIVKPKEDVVLQPDSVRHTMRAGPP